MLTLDMAIVLLTLLVAIDASVGNTAASAFGIVVDSMD